MTGKNGKKQGRTSDGRAGHKEKSLGSGAKQGNGERQRLKTEEGLPLFRKMMKEEGFNPKEPKKQAAWEAFRRFSAVSFDCAGDSLVFEAGMFDYTDDEPLYCLSFIRQFTIEVEGEYDYIEQIHLDLFYRPDETLRNLEETIWTCDFDDEFPPFFEAVERSEAFSRLGPECQPSSCEIYQDEV